MSDQEAGDSKPKIQYGEGHADNYYEGVKAQGGGATPGVAHVNTDDPAYIAPNSVAAQKSGAAPMQASQQAAPSNVVPITAGHRVRGGSIASVANDPTLHRGTGAEVNTAKLSMAA